MAEERSFSLEGVAWGSLEDSWEAGAFPLSRLIFGAITCFEEIPELENQE